MRCSIVPSAPAQRWTCHWWTNSGATATAKSPTPSATTGAWRSTLKTSRLPKCSAAPRNGRRRWQKRPVKAEIRYRAFRKKLCRLQNCSLFVAVDLPPIEALELRHFFGAVLLIPAAPDERVGRQILIRNFL